MNLGFFELTLFGIIALVVLGPEKLPVAARTIGKWYGMFRRASTRLQSEITSELQLLEAQEQLKAELAKIKESESAMKAQMTQLQQSLNQTQKQLQDSVWLDESGNKEEKNAWQLIAESADDTTQHHQDFHQQAATENALNIPLVNRWFLLGDYDKKRRLPSAPFMPNYVADPLLHQSSS